MTAPDPRTYDRELAGRQVVAKVLADEVKALTEQTRAVLEHRLGPRESTTAHLPDGTVIGQVSRTRASVSAKVVDEAALLAWVVEHRPDEVVQSVRSSYVKVLQAQARSHGRPFDVETGEVIPGIEMVEGSSSYTVKADPQARALVLPALADLIAGGLLELPAAPVEQEGDAA